MVTSVRMTSATRRSRIVFAAVSTAFLAAASHDSLLTPITSVTLYTLSDISPSPFVTLAEGTTIAGTAGAARPGMGPIVRRSSHQRASGLRSLGRRSAARRPTRRPLHPRGGAARARRRDPPIALQLRYLQTLIEVSASNNTT